MKNDFQTLIQNVEKKRENTTQTVSTLKSMHDRKQIKHA